MNAGRIIGSTVKKFIVFGSLAVMLVTIVSSMNHSFTEKFAYDMANTFEMVRTDDNNTITFNDLNMLRTEAESYKISGYSEIISGVANKFGIYAGGIRIVLTDNEYMSIYKNEMLAGSFPDMKAIQNREAYVVISDKLAVELFKSIDIIGNEIVILGQKYTVTGVYKSNSSILWSLSGDGFDRIFIPYSSFENYKKKPIDVLAMLGMNEQSKYDTKRLLEAGLGSKVSSYDIIDYSISATVLHQYFKLVIFLIGVLGILFTLIFFVKYTINTIRYLKKKAGSFYALEILRAESNKVVHYLCVFLSCSIAVILLAKLIRFKFFTSDKYIPYDNIFDVQFYLKSVFSDITLANAKVISIYSNLEHTFKNALQAELFLTVMIVILIFAAFMFFKLLLFHDMRLIDILKLPFLTIFIGGTIGVFISACLGFGLFFPAKDWLIMLYYPIIVICSRKNHSISNLE